ncbi:MAG: DUF3313 family protein [Lysobacteraceae bacterium]
MDAFHRPPALFRCLAPMAVLLLLVGCASAPKASQDGLASARTLETLRDEPYARAARFLDAEAVLAARSVSPPRVAVAEGAAGEGIAPGQATLVANRAAREVCQALAPYYRITDEAPDLAIDLRVTSVAPTSAGTAGVSEILGVFIPGPFRLPAGLGGFAADGAARAPGGDVLVLRWAEGANPVTEDAKLSRIGDAYQLAGDFADDFAAALVDPRAAAGDRRPRLDEATIDANRAACLARFGRANPAGRGASILLPLAPEAIDAGAPAEAPDDERG